MKAAFHISFALPGRFYFRAAILPMAACLTAAVPSPAQQPERPALANPQQAEFAITGQIFDASGKQASGAFVKLTSRDGLASSQTTTDASGNFTLKAPFAGDYSIEAAAEGTHSEAMPLALARGSAKHIRLILLAEQNVKSDHVAAPVALGKEIEFSDKPDFTVAGVTDWTAVGGHGSDATLRTSESLARATLTLQAPAIDKAPLNGADVHAQETVTRLRTALAAKPANYAANKDLGQYFLQAGRYAEALPLLRAAFEMNHAQPDDEYNLALACRGLGDLAQAKQHVQHALTQKDAADFHRLNGELHEGLGDPVAAVEELRRATQLDPSEANYLAWGSELLLHRAIWQAAEIFEDGVKGHPDSARLKMALGTAFFSGALYDRAAEQICEASDMDPSDAETYAVMGKVELAAPTALPCIEQRLARFQTLHPERAEANFLFAMTLLKSDRELNRARIESLLTTAVKLDPHYSEAYLQLGILAFARHNYPEAIAFYTKAVETDPSQGEAHYRLAAAYDRAGESEKAKQELRIHDEIEKAQADAIEQERRKIKQFLVTQVQPAPASKP